MPALGAGIHVFFLQDVDGRDKPGHDDSVRLVDYPNGKYQNRPPPKKLAPMYAESLKCRFSRTPVPGAERFEIKGFFPHCTQSPAYA